MAATCLVEACGRAVHGHGWCETHYRRWRRSGSVELPSIAERFWAKVDTSGGPDVCWPWLAHHDRKGYGGCRIEGGWRVAHRVAWELTHGPIPDGLLVCHHCDEPPCCNPQHLFLGTDADNAADRDSKGRQNGGRGDAHPSAKLSFAKAREIRARYTAGGVTQAVLAGEFGVGQDVISRLLAGRTWREEG